MELTFEESQRSLWPALVLLKGSGASADGLLERVRTWLGTTRPHGHEDDSPERLMAPATTRDVIDWLSSVWRGLEEATQGQLAARRRLIGESIVHSRLPQDQQAGLLTALDYLYRLNVAARVARTAGGSRQEEIPVSRNPLMQRVYHRLAALAATDLPLWLTGEKGTELEWMGRLVHRLRGSSDKAFRVWDMIRMQQKAVSDPWWDFPDLTADGAETTVLITRIDTFPAHWQQLLHDFLVRQLTRPDSCRIIATSIPLSLEEGVLPGVCPELFAFLSATRIEVPPLRSRIEDLDSLISFLARSRNLKDPVGRLGSAAMQILRAHHWPGNLEELDRVMTHAVRRKPTGIIGIGDLPEMVLPPSPEEQLIVLTLEAIYRQSGFRVLQSEPRRIALARFLVNASGRPFAALDLQKNFNLGRETARRLLNALMERSLVTGIKGAGGTRITRYVTAETEHLPDTRRRKPVKKGS